MKGVVNSCNRMLCDIYFTADSKLFGSSPYAFELAKSSALIVVRFCPKLSEPIFSGLCTNKVFELIVFDGSTISVPLGKLIQEYS